MKSFIMARGGLFDSLKGVTMARYYYRCPLCYCTQKIELPASEAEGFSVHCLCDVTEPRMEKLGPEKTLPGFVIRDPTWARDGWIYDELD